MAKIYYPRAHVRHIALIIGGDVARFGDNYPSTTLDIEALPDSNVEHMCSKWGQLFFPVKTKASQMVAIYRQWRHEMGKEYDVIYRALLDQFIRLPLGDPKGPKIISLTSDLEDPGKMTHDFLESAESFFTVIEAGDQGYTQSTPNSNLYSVTIHGISFFINPWRDTDELILRRYRMLLSDRLRHSMRVLRETGVENLPMQYAVIGGDTLSDIAHNHGVSLDEIVEMNPHITDVNQIFLGDLINIPTRKY